MANEEMCDLRGKHVWNHAPEIEGEFIPPECILCGLNWMDWWHTGKPFTEALDKLDERNPNY